MAISFQDQRVFKGTADISLQMSDYHSNTYAMTYVAGQYVYVGMRSPFNNIFIQMSTVAVSTSGTPVVDVWWGSTWTSAVDITDQTSGMTASGRISWALEKNKGWEAEEYSADVGITGSKVYDMYWARISWPNNFSATLQYIGQKFSEDADLRILYPDLMQTQLLTGHTAGKTNWNDQHFAASEYIVKDMFKRNIIRHKGQIFDWQTFEQASVHKVAEIIYRAFGAPYREHADKAEAKYNVEMGQSMKNVDIDQSGYIVDVERTDRKGWMTR